MTNYAWLQLTLERISDLLKMPDKHNCYGTPKVDATVALDALDFLSDHMGPEDVIPRITPTSEGGLRFEWNGRSSFCSAELNPGGKVMAVHGQEASEGFHDAGRLIESALIRFSSEAA